jgi:anti-anti-sigma regulatory factor
MPRKRSTADHEAMAQSAQEKKVLTAINRIFRERLRCETEEELGAVCLKVAEELTGSSFGYFGELNVMGLFDTIAISNPGWEACSVPEGEARLVIQNMPIRGIDRGTMSDGEPRIVNGAPAFFEHPEHVDMPDGHPEMTSFLGVPLKEEGKVVGMIALANKEGGYTIEDQEAVEALSGAMLEALRSKRAEDRIAAQTEEILEVSTPVMQIWDGIVVAPLVGTMSTDRTQQFMERLLETIVETRSPVALVDITAVPTVDTRTAQHLIEAITAARLLGADVILTGVRPAIAQTLVHLGIDLSDVKTRSSLAAGLKLALRRAGLEVVRREKEGGPRRAPVGASPNAPKR